MLKYMSIVKDAYEMRGTQAFRTYDQSFRLLRARNNLPWQKPIDELFTKSEKVKGPLDFEDCFDMVIRLGPRVTDQGSSKSSLGNKSAKFMNSLFHIFSFIR
jgi:hypothetical protein